MGLSKPLIWLDRCLCIHKCASNVLCICACVRMRVCACATPSDTQTLAAKEEGDKIHAGSKDAARVWAQIRLLHGCSRHFFAAFSSVLETQDRD